MRFPLFCAASAFIAAGIIACSSSSTDKTKVPLTGEGGPAGATGGGGKASGSGGTTGSGGNTAGTGGADPAACEIDSGADPCRLCLMGHCCDDFKSCESDAVCASTFRTYQTCVKGAKGDANVVSECFSTFAGSLGSTRSGFTSCDVLSCSAECGGPLTL
jgi:hypothetical protein